MLQETTTTATPFMRQLITFAVIAMWAGYNYIGRPIITTSIQRFNVINVISFAYLFTAPIAFAFLSLILEFYIFVSIKTLCILFSGNTTHDGSPAFFGMCASIYFIFLAQFFFVRFSIDFMPFKLCLMVLVISFLICFTVLFSVLFIVGMVTFTTHTRKRLFSTKKVVSVTRLDLFTFNAALQMFRQSLKWRFSLGVTPFTTVFFVTVSTPTVQTILRFWWFSSREIIERGGFFLTAFSTAFDRSIHSVSFSLYPVLCVVRAAGFTTFSGINLDYIEDYSKLGVMIPDLGLV